VERRRAELHSALANVGPRDRFINRSRVPMSVWIEMAGRAAMLALTFGITSSAISAAVSEFRVQTRHANAAKEALDSLGCPTAPEDMERRRADLIKDWVTRHSARKRANGQLKPVKTRDELRKDIVAWNRGKRLVRGAPGFVSTCGSHDALLRRLAEATVWGSFTPILDIS